MILFPAIDIKDGVCVRLIRGDMQHATVYNQDPLKQALWFEQQGAAWIHIVDLNGAFAGVPVNAGIVKKIRSQTKIKLQLGGGIRSLETISYWIKIGIDRVVLGTAALTHPELVEEACHLFPGRIAVGIDARQGKVAVEGWAKTTEVTVEGLAKQLEHKGVSALIYTDISRDGVLQGPDIEGTLALAAYTSIPVIASGGVSSLEDIKALKKVTKKGIAGVICGRAIYDGRVDIKEALQVCEGSYA